MRGETWPTPSALKEFASCSILTLRGQLQRSALLPGPQTVSVWLATNSPNPLKWAIHYTSITREGIHLKWKILAGAFGNSTHIVCKRIAVAPALTAALDCDTKPKLIRHSFNPCSIISSDLPTNRELLHSWTQARFPLPIRDFLQSRPLNHISGLPVVQTQSPGSGMGTLRGLAPLTWSVFFP